MKRFAIWSMSAADLLVAASSHAEPARLTDVQLDSVTAGQGLVEYALILVCEGCAAENKVIRASIHVIDPIRQRRVPHPVFELYLAPEPPADGA